MRAVYVGILTEGTTSRMRAEGLRGLTPEWEWTWIDTDKPMQRSARLWRSLAFRLKAGPAVRGINATVNAHLPDASFDVVWVDKGVFLRSETVALLRRAASRLVHFTPDTAFHANRSRHFNHALQHFDLVVTTKSFELDEYRRRVDDERLLLTTQGYDAKVHFPRGENATRRRDAVFVGLCEPDREEAIGALLEEGVPVRLAGRKWGSFLRRYENCPQLEFLGEGLFGDAYAELLSSSWVGLGLLSKKFPELHTTRTFEIPACGAILATERTADTERFFDSSEVLFFDDYQEMAPRIKSLLDTGSDDELASLANAGRRRVEGDGRDYESILAGIFERAMA